MKLTTQHKFNRKQTLDTLLKLKNGEDLNECEIDMMINYFAPSLPKKPKDILDYAARFTADLKEKREVLRYIYIDKERNNIVSTNGMIMFIGDNKDQEFGFVDPKTKMKIDAEQYVKYPDYMRAFPRFYDDSSKINFDPSSSENEINIISGQNIITINEFKYNMKYINMIEFFDEVYQVDHNGFVCLVVHNKFGKVALMPLR